jgi:CheY-like chemotaxis protein
VDDNEDSLLGMVNMLVSSGFIVEIARSGKECHQLLAARIGTDDAPDVVGAALDVIS